MLALLAAAALQAAPPPCGGGAYDDFDFWVGEWRVSAPDDTFQGANSISKAENGCLIIERWTGASGSTGQSYNFYDPKTERWRQVWVSAGSVIDYEGGLDEAGAMRLEGRISYRASGKSFPFRGVWTPADDGSVRQHFTQYDPEKDEWADWFVGVYRRAE